MKAYKSESNKILLQNPELNSIISNDFSPDTYPFKLTNYLGTAKNMYGRDMTDEDFSYCSIIGWGALKIFEKQHPDEYKIVIDNLEIILSKWCNKYNEDKQLTKDDFLMITSLWTIYFNSERLDNNRSSTFPLTGEKLTSLDSKVGYGEMIAFLSACWKTTCEYEFVSDESGEKLRNYDPINSFGVSNEMYKSLRHLKGNYLLSVANGWNIKKLFCALGTGIQYFSEILKANSKLNNFNILGGNLLFGDLVVTAAYYLNRAMGPTQSVSIAIDLARLFLPTLYGEVEEADKKFSGNYFEWYKNRYIKSSRENLP